MLWIPEITPPQVSEEAKEQVSHQLLEHGLSVVADEALHSLQTDCDALAAYLDELGFTLNEISAEGAWPARTLNFGAALTFFAYREAYYFPEIHSETIQTGHRAAKVDGIPEAYLMSLHCDSKLQEVINTALDAPVFNEYDVLPTDAGGYRQILEIGAGCTRFYMQQALAS